MIQAEFHKLVHLVMDSPAKPPEKLFMGGMDDWHSRARLAHFLAMQGIDKIDEAIELFRSVAPEEIDEEDAEDVEEKVFALQKLASVERDTAGGMENALRHIGEAIELAESTDFLYKYILRGELWADRWNILQRMGRGAEAEEEVDERIAAYKEIPIEHNSYLFYGYRFKAMRAAEQDLALVAKDYMHMAVHSMEIPKNYAERIENAFAVKHENASWILTEVDKALPPTENLHWDI